MKVQNVVLIIRREINYVEIWNFHYGNYKEYCLQRCDVMYAVEIYRLLEEHYASILGVEDKMEAKGQ
jgi:hypothetical protein